MQLRVEILGKDPLNTKVLHYKGDYEVTQRGHFHETKTQCYLFRVLIEMKGIEHRYRRKYFIGLEVLEG